MTVREEKQAQPELDRIEAATRENHFARIPAVEMRPLLEAFGMSDWEGFAASWERLGVDLYMADGGRYRRRRYATFALAEDAIIRKKHQPHYQSRDYNALNGGIERWFEPVEREIGAHPVMHAVLSLIRRLATDLTPIARRPEAWHAEVHQFRIEARDNEAGQPTPEGLHRDGVDWVLVLMVRRENVASGETTIHDLQGNELGSFTLSSPMDAAFVNDNQVFHGVTPIQPVRPDAPAFRDVMVVTLRHQ
ncbi:hypothetical protein AA0472_0328 [Acetobacter estunensis NRIC 0472]|uniref:2OG-Fe dioxygenase family protein n=1 Tax=Acetobacter estunensis TaxID=104097 RepID=A0A967B5F7_9PROT|nr:2OG-Fe dioxygenase family protein [Acetobacter estunensis]NHO53579.1 hypothetical protein [Acetobacter estunensis]GBQ21050.1 hypothetical protein AA0472_0328 [Acetobacter estunensis NRIC 0472]